jgi:hypothetical protein
MMMMIPEFTAEKGLPQHVLEIRFHNDGCFLQDNAPCLRHENLLGAVCVACTADDSQGIAAALLKAPSNLVAKMSNAAEIQNEVLQNKSH